MEQYQPKPKQAAILKRAKAYVDSVVYKVTARWLFYRLLQDGTYRDKGAYKAQFLSLISKARKCFFDGWRPDTLADDTRDLIPGGNGFDDEREWLEAVRDDEWCNLNKWQGQDHYIEVWFEAAAMGGQFRHYIREIPLLAFHGDVSIPAKWKAAKRLEEASERHGLPIVVLYFGDHDEKGVQIPESALADIRTWCSVDFEFIRCGLNEGDGERFGIPEDPDKPGHFQWEALDDGQAGGLITSSVARYYDLDRLKEIDELEAEITEKFQKKFGRFIAKWT